MIIQSEQGGFPQYVHKLLFIIGLSIYTCGQFLIKLGQDFVDHQSPVDFAHWLLIIGVLFFVPFVGRLPLKNIHILGVPLILLGISFVIGMSVIDFIFWSLPNDKFEQELAEHLISTEVIWQPFIVFGSSYIFHTGLLIPSLSYFSNSKIGTLLVILGTVFIAIGTQWLIVIGYCVLTYGYFLNFDNLRRFKS
jgi:hypothetical protein